jgi:hypothetical protein
MNQQKVKIHPKEQIQTVAPGFSSSFVCRQFYTARGTIL